MTRVALLFVVFSLTACATATYSSGRDFSEQSVAQIQKNKTTEQDVLNLCGEPSSKSSGADTSEIWSYVYISSTSHAKNKIFSMDVNTSTVHKNLTITLQGGLVSDYKYTVGGSPGALNTQLN